MSPSRGLQPCTTPGCGELVRSGKCATCRPRAEAGRGTPAERGYGPAHQALRKRWAPLVAAGGVACWRCGEPIGLGQPWDLGHADEDRGRHRGPEHAACNRAAPRLRAVAARRARRR